MSVAMDPDYQPPIIDFTLSSIFASELTAASPVFTWEAGKKEPVGLVGKVVPIGYQLTISRVVIGEDAKDGELNMIEMQCYDDKEAIVKMPLAYLKMGVVYQSKIDLLLPGDYAKFELKLGSGPVHIVGTINSTEREESEAEVATSDTEELEQEESITMEVNTGSKKRKETEAESNGCTKRARTAEISDETTSMTFSDAEGD